MRTLLLLLPVLALTALTSACKEDAEPSPDAGTPTPALLEADLTTDGQHATVGTALPKALRVQVLDTSGAPMPGLTVEWAVLSGGGTLGGASSLTGAEGRAEMTWTLGTTATLQRVEARVAGLSPIVLSARGLPGPVAQVMVTATSPTVEVERTQKLGVSLVDAYDNAVTGRPITWSSSDESVAVVDSEGTVRGVLPGSVRITATSEGVSGGVDLAVSWSADAIVFTSVAVGTRHACATLRGGEAFCWGADSQGALGNGADTTRKLTPSPVTMPEGVKFTQVTSGGDNSCALTVGGQAYCWGPNDFGQLGTGTLEASDVPVPVKNPEGAVFTTLTQSGTHVCALTSPGDAYCWGYNLDGNLGDRGFENQPAPVRVIAPEGVSGFDAIAPGGGFTCAVSKEGDVYCWGYNGDGQLGDGTTESREVPAKADAPAGVLFKAVHAGYDYACAVSRGGDLYCWGSNAKGQLGTGDTQSTLKPVKVSAPVSTAFVSSSGESLRACALTQAGTVLCWGDNSAGQLGNDSTQDSSLPVQALLPAGVKALSVSAGPYATCAVTIAGEAFCWGQNLNGLLGNGSDALLSKVPLKVSEPPAP